VLRRSTVPLSIGSDEFCGEEVTLLIAVPLDEEIVLFGSSVGRLGLDVEFVKVTFCDTGG